MEVRKTLLVLVAMTTVTVPILTGCGHADPATADSPAVEHSAAPDPEPAEASTPAEEPEPVDPDEVFLDSIREQPMISGRMHKVAGEMAAWTSSATLAEGARAAHTVSDSFAWIANRMDADPTSADSPLAQDTMATMRLCRDAYDAAATAIDDVDPDAMDAAGPSLTECNRGIEGIHAQF